MYYNFKTAQNKIDFSNYSGLTETFGYRKYTLQYKYRTGLNKFRKKNVTIYHISINLR